MACLSKKVIKLRNKYYEIFNIYPRGWYIGSETMTEYENYLQKELEKIINYKLLRLEN